MGWKLFLLIFILFSSFSVADETKNGPGSGKLLLPEQLKPEIVSVVPSRFFVPQGFDDNDKIQFVVEGSFPNTCYRLKGAYAKRSKTDRNKILVSVQAYHFKGCFCAPMNVSYHKVLGVRDEIIKEEELKNAIEGDLEESRENIILESGEYEIVAVVNGKTETKVKAKLPVGVANSPSPDEFLYAPVDSIHMETKEAVDVINIGENGPIKILKHFLVLEGNLVLKPEEQDHASKPIYLTWQNMEVLIRENNVIEILPIVAIANEGSNPQKRYKKVQELPLLKPGKYLIHIRATNGESMNMIYEI